MNKLLTPLKKEERYSWLNEISTVTLQRSCADLAQAYKVFFKGTAKHPRFKSKKKSKPSFPVRESLYFQDGNVTLEKFGKVKIQTNYVLPSGKGHKYSNPRIQRTANGKWILTVGVERENQAPVLTDKPMGVDLGIKETAVVSFGDEQIIFHNINKSRKMRQLTRKLKHLQRNVARKYDAHKSFEKTKSICKAEQKVALLHKRICDIRTDNRHKMTHTLVSLLPSHIVMEDLNVSGMMKNRHLSKAISQQGFYDILFQMQYKAEDRGIPLLKADRFYPSSKTCSSCGFVHKGLRLSDRTFVCPSCGKTLDRDYNAAINLMRYTA